MDERNSWSRNRILFSHIERNIRDNKTQWFVNWRFRLKIRGSNFDCDTARVHNRTSCTVYVSLSLGRCALFIWHVSTMHTRQKKCRQKLINGMDQLEILMNRLQCQTMLIYYTFQFDASMLSNPNSRVDERNIWTNQTVNVFAKALNFNLII